MKKNISIVKVLPVMFGFFIMGFVDIIGIAINNVKSDFELTDTMVNLISLSCFFWFLVLSIPTGMLMNKIGRKKTVLLSFIFHVAAMCLPIFSYEYVPIIIAFSLIGIGNTLLQVSLNPLITDVVSKDKLTGTLTLGQFIKALSSFFGPILAGWVSGCVWGWKLIFPIYAITSLLALLWLSFTPIQEEQITQKEVSFATTFQLFKDKYITAFFIGILVLVSVDVSINITFPKILIERCGLPVADAGMGNSVYFFARTVGTFLGGLLLMKFSEKKFFVYSVWLAFAGLVLMAFCNELWLILGCVVLFGIGYANLFSIIFSLSLKRMPQKANEVSALLIVGISGSAILPPLLGVISDTFHSQLAAIIVLAVIWCYLIGLKKKIETV